MQPFGGRKTQLLSTCSLELYYLARLPLEPKHQILCEPPFPHQRNGDGDGIHLLNSLSWWAECGWWEVIKIFLPDRECSESYHQCPLTSYCHFCLTWRLYYTLYKSVPKDTTLHTMELCYLNNRMGRLLTSFQDSDPAALVFFLLPWSSVQILASWMQGSHPSYTGATSPRY